MLITSGMQLKNRIQMLEKVIIDARSSSGDNLQIGSVRSDSESLTLYESPSPSNKEVPTVHHALDCDVQNSHAEWNFLETPSSQGGSYFDQSRGLNLWDTTDMNYVNMTQTLHSPRMQNSWEPMEVGLQDFSKSNPTTPLIDLGVCSFSDLANSQKSPRSKDFEIELSSFLDSSDENIPNPRSRKKTKGATKLCEVGSPISIP